MWKSFYISYKMDFKPPYTVNSLVQALMASYCLNEETSKADGVKESVEKALKASLRDKPLGQVTKPPLMQAFLLMAVFMRKHLVKEDEQSVEHDEEGEEGEVRESFLDTQVLEEDDVPVISNPNDKDVKDSSESPPICRFYLKNSCKYKASGLKGGGDVNSFTQRSVGLC